jgi:hypothetical protein
MKETVYYWLFIRVIRGRWHLNVGLDASFDTMQDWKGIREKAGEELIL